MNLKNLWSEFKAFAFKGNMIELAVAVVIGAAFSTVINSLVNDVIMPTVGYAVNTATMAAEKAKDVAVSTVNAAASKAGISTSQPTTEAATQAVATPSTTQTASATTAGAQPPPANNSVVATQAPTPNQPDGGTATPPPPTAPVQIHLMIGPVNAGAFIGSLLNFLLVAGAVFLVIVKLLGSVMKKVGKPAEPSEPTTRECPECLSLIPTKARRCPACTSVIAPIGSPEVQ